MDVINSNVSDAINKKKHKRSRINAKIKQFSIEIYFMWFSALIFFAETFVGKSPLIHISIEIHINIPLFNLKIRTIQKAENESKFVCCKQVNVEKTRKKERKKMR